MSYFCRPKILETKPQPIRRIHFSVNPKAVHIPIVFSWGNVECGFFMAIIYFLPHICWNKPTDVVLEGLKLRPPYTRSILRPILAHTSLNAQPIQGIGQSVHQAITNSGRNTVWTLGGDRLLATETHHVTCKGNYILFDPYWLPKPWKSAGTSRLDTLSWQNKGKLFFQPFYDKL